MDTFPMLKPRSQHLSSKRKQRQWELASGAEQESLPLPEHCRGDTDFPTGVIIHVMAYLSSGGIPRVSAGIVAGAIPLFSIIAGGMLAFCYVEVMWVALLFLLLSSPGYGGGLLLRGATLRQYFGRDSIGTLLGITMGSASIGGIIGPTFAGGYSILSETIILYGLL